MSISGLSFSVRLRKRLVLAQRTINTSSPASSFHTMVIAKGKAKKAFNFVDHIDRHDYRGALTILELGSCEGLSSAEKLLWTGYCLSRLHEFSQAKEVYEELLSGQHNDALSEDDLRKMGLYLAISNFYLGHYAEAEQSALSVPDESELKNRILLSVARSTDDETKLAKYRQYLSNSKQDELSAAATELYRCHYNETADIYETMLSENDDLALNVYLAICYFKMVSQFNNVVHQSQKSHINIPFLVIINPGLLRIVSRSN